MSWLPVVVAVWCVASVPIGVFIGKAMKQGDRDDLHR